VGEETFRILKEPDEVFDAKLHETMELAKRNADAMRNISQPRYEEMDNDEGMDRFDPISIHSHFIRAGLAISYTDIHQPQEGRGGTDKEVIAVKLQHNWLASLERDMHLRKRTRVRLEAHAATRARSVGHDKGPLGSGIDRVLGLMLAIEP